jgi:hypothetical protein
MGKLYDQQTVTSLEHGDIETKVCDYYIKSNIYMSNPEYKHIQSQVSKWPFKSLGQAFLLLMPLLLITQNRHEE